MDALNAFSALAARSFRAARWRRAHWAVAKGWFAMAKKGAIKRKSLYDVHPGVKMMQDWVAALPEKTGRSLAQWLTLVKKEGPATEAERRDWLKKVHGHGTNAAWWIAEQSVGKSNDSDPEVYLREAAKYVEDMYAGGKAALRPIHDRLMALARSLGSDIRICPCKTIVPIYREHVIAQIKPSTKTRIDFGLALKGSKRKPGKRLIDTGGLEKKDRITHRIPIESIEDIDDEVESWLRIAYELDGS